MVSPRFKRIIQLSLFTSRLLFHLFTKKIQTSSSLLPRFFFLPIISHLIFFFAFDWKADVAWICHDFLLLPHFKYLVLNADDDLLWAFIIKPHGSVDFRFRTLIVGQLLLDLKYIIMSLRTRHLTIDFWVTRSICFLN